MTFIFYQSLIIFFYEMKNVQQWNNFIQNDFQTVENNDITWELGELKYSKNIYNNEKAFYTHKL